MSNHKSLAILESLFISCKLLFSNVLKKLAKLPLKSIFKSQAIPTYPLKIKVISQSFSNFTFLFLNFLLIFSIFEYSNFHQMEKVKKDFPTCNFRM